MKILLAGPGTGKTTRIKSLISQDFLNATRIRVLSFTNFTVDDLTQSFRGDDRISCSTLHSFAFSLNHQKNLYVATNDEKRILKKIAEKTGFDLAQVCEQLKCITFDQMIERCVSFLEANPVYAKEKIGNLDLLLVDEFQDFNPAEQSLVKSIAGLAEETIILGDDDQSIYGFKDADPDGIISIFSDPNVERIRHENKCYRCPDEIVNLSSKLIAANTKRIAKEWHKTGKDGRVAIEQFMTSDEADDYVFKRIVEIKELEPDASVLVLSPIRVIVDSLREKLGQYNHDCVYCWSEPDLDVQSQIWWLCAIFGDDTFKFLIFLLGSRRIASNQKIQSLLQEAIESGVENSRSLEKLLEGGFLEEKLTKYIGSGISLDQFFSEEPEFELLNEKIDRTDVKKSVLRLASEFRGGHQFEKGKINLMSIHKSKGLQAEYVFIIGLTTGILPNDQQGIDTIEAQRRLLFVGMTRALKELYLLSTVEWNGGILRGNNADISQFQFRYKTRTYRGKASRFIEEIT